MDKLIISFNGHSTDEIASTSGVIMTIPWDALQETISQRIHLRDYEKIDGLIVTDTDIRVKISRRKGRKIVSKV